MFLFLRVLVEILSGFDLVVVLYVLPRRRAVLHRIGRLCLLRACAWLLLMLVSAFQKIHCCPQPRGESPPRAFGVNARCCYVKVWSWCALRDEDCSLGQVSFPLQLSEDGLGPVGYPRLGF